MDAVQIRPMTLKQVAERVGVSYKQITREVKAGRLKARHKKGETKTWYVMEDDLLEWANGGMLE